MLRIPSIYTWNAHWGITALGVLGFLLLFPVLLAAQQTELFSQTQALPERPLLLHAQSLQIQQRGMLLLGGWAGLNMLTGGIATFRTEGSRTYFHQMNAAWNVVNAGIAIFGYRGTLQKPALTTPEILSAMQQFDHILLINAGLDVLYISGGAWLLYRGLRQDNNRWKGYGQSIILQGSFLFLFDLLLYLTHEPLTQSLKGLNSPYFSLHLANLPLPNATLFTDVTSLMPVFQLHLSF